MQASPAIVEEVLLDARLYPLWIVGTEECDGVHPPWPKPGGGFTYAVKIGPLRFHDRTTMLEHIPGTQVRLRIAMHPLGQAIVVLRFEQHPLGTMVTFIEHPDRGPAHIVWNPLFDWLLHRRNVTALRRLREMAERRATLNDPYEASAQAAGSEPSGSMT